MAFHLRSASGSLFVALSALAMSLVTSATVEAAPFSADCIIRPSQVVRVGAPVPGIIAEIRVDRGDKVAAGDILASLDTRLQDASIRSAQTRVNNTTELEAARAKVGFLTARAERNRSLVKRDIIPQSTLDEVETDLLTAQNDLATAEQNRTIAGIDLEQAETERERRIIRSPIDGYVTEKALSVGEYWREDTPIVTIANLSQLHIDAIMGIDTYDDVTIGDMATVTPEAPLGGQYEAVVEVVDPVLDAASGTFGVRLVMDNSTARLPAGLRCLAQFSGPADGAGSDGAPREGQ